MARLVECVGIVGIVLVAGCLVSPDEALWRRRAEAHRDAGPEAAAADLGLDTPAPGDVGVEGGACSAAGTPWPCDPVALTGCAQGSCYVLPTAGQACVCPAGTIAVGSPCTTTKLCKPGTLCAGTAAPGICRQVCRADQDASVCPAGRFCRYLTKHPSFGYCDRVPDAGAGTGG